MFLPTLLIATVLNIHTMDKTEITTLATPAQQIAELKKLKEAVADWASFGVAHANSVGQTYSEDRRNYAAAQNGVIASIAFHAYHFTFYINKNKIAMQCTQAYKSPAPNLCKPISIDCTEMTPELNAQLRNGIRQLADHVITSLRPTSSTVTQLLKSNPTSNALLSLETEQTYASLTSTQQALVAMIDGNIHRLELQSGLGALCVKTICNQFNPAIMQTYLSHYANFDVISQIIENLPQTTFEAHATLFLPIIQNPHAPDDLKNLIICKCLELQSNNQTVLRSLLTAVQGTPFFDPVINRLNFSVNSKK